MAWGDAGQRPVQRLVFGMEERSRVGKAPALAIVRTRIPIAV
jgi:hypothetical protein